MRPFTPHLVLVVGWLALLPLTGHYGNPDGPSYVVVAQRWAELDLPAAVNAYWGPLLSWGAAPLVAVGVPGLVALRIVLLVGGLLTFAPLRALCHRAGAGRVATDVVLVAVAPFLVYAALFGLYADVLMCAALLRSLDLLTREGVDRRPGVAVRAGAWAGVAFLARAYALPVALVVLPLVALGRRWTTPTPPGTRDALRTTGLALAGLGLVAGAWTGVLSGVYGQPTFSTSAGFNAELVAPGSAGNPFNVRGLYPPVREGGMSAWEEPSELPVPVRSDAEGGEVGQPDLAHRVGLAVANARIVVGSVLRRGAPLAGLAVLALAWHARRRQLPAAALAAPLAAGAVAAGGLLLIIAIERYLWLPILATAPAAAVGLHLLWRERPRWGRPAAGLLVLVMAATSLHGLLPRVGAHQEVTAAAQALENAGLEGHVATVDSWQRSHLLCFRVGCTYVGRPEARDAAAAAEELRSAGVDHLLVWAGDAEGIQGVADLPEGVELRVLAVTADGFEIRHDVVADPAGATAP